MIQKNKRKIKALEDICVFCGLPNGEASIVLALSSLLKGKKKALGNPCEKCAGFLDSGDIGFIEEENGAAIITSKKDGLKIMKRFGILARYIPGKRNVIKVKKRFWKIKNNP
jgi:hypothetical protein